MKDYKYLHIENTSPYFMIRNDPPVGYLKFMNVTVALYGKMPNKIQRWMLKRWFNFEITEA